MGMKGPLVLKYVVAWLLDYCHWYFHPFEKFCSWFLSYSGDESQEYDSLNPEIQYQARMQTCVVFSICWRSKQRCWDDSVRGNRCISTCKSTVGWGAEASGIWNTEQKWCPVKYWVQEKGPVETLFQVSQLKRPSAITFSPITEDRIGESAEQQIFPLYIFLLYSKQYWVR